MPITSQVNWTLAKVLRGQGLRWEDIAPQVHAKAATLRTRACREGWSAINKETANALTRFGYEQAAKVIERQAPKTAEVWLAKVQTNTLKAAEAFDKLPIPNNIDDFKTYEETADKHVKRGRAAFGLDDRQGGGATVNVMAQLCQIAVSATPVADVAGGATQCCSEPEVVDVQGE